METDKQNNRLEQLLRNPLEARLPEKRSRGRWL